MDEKVRSIMLVGSSLTFLYGLVLQKYALWRHRAPDCDGPWMSFDPRNWRERREWFSSEYGYRLYRWAGWHTLLGSLAMTALWFMR
ncbi:MAG TPA: hypothetical protein VFH88_09360 [Candidatus Krumholzibacteria bacterium]|nr:hypothetical protein [Candidatus Krumholzibacteria bacterium]